MMIGFGIGGIAHVLGMLAAAPQLPITPTTWFLFALIGALSVAGVAAMVYMLAPLMASKGMRQWAVMQAYEAVLSIALILVFLAFTWIFFINPQASFQASNLVPVGCTGASNIFTLSVCDLAQFQNASYAIVRFTYEYNLYKSLIPGLMITVMPVPTSPGINISITIPNVLQTLVLGTLDSFDSLVSTYLNDIVVFLLFGQVQLIVLSGSLLFFSFFMAAGLIARVFGFSRSFGGAMIAFGIGLGLLYPLITAITYGFIDVSANTACLQSLQCAAGAATLSIGQNAGNIALGGATSITNTAGSYANFLIQLLTLGLSGNGLIPSVSGASLSTSVGAALASVFDEFGYILSGLTVIPVINIFIVDVFIVDFSSAIGEKMSFMQLFKGMV
jgi:hypothetical protein